VAKLTPAYEKALEIDPRHATAWSNKGRSLSALERPDEALPYCTMALEIEPKNSFAWDNKGRVLYALSRYDDASNVYKFAVPRFRDKAVYAEVSDGLNWVHAT
jgi:tetratricopeptide (TPR) repeat protein